MLDFAVHGILKETIDPGGLALDLAQIPECAQFSLRLIMRTLRLQCTRRDSNPRPTGCKPAALPLSYPCPLYKSCSTRPERVFLKIAIARTRGDYYAFLRHQGKLIKRSLKTADLPAALSKLGHLRQSLNARSQMKPLRDSKIDSRNQFPGIELFPPGGRQV